MTTLLTVIGSDGQIIDCCDARCYDAVLPRCDCVCGGINHGVGLDQAMENTMHMAEEAEKEELLDNFKHRRKRKRYIPRVDTDTLTIRFNDLQPALPGF